MNFDGLISEAPQTFNPTENPASTTTDSRATVTISHSTTPATFEAVGLILLPRAPGLPLPCGTSENAKDVLDVLGPLIRDMGLFTQFLENMNNNRETTESAVEKVAAQTIKMKNELPGLRSKVDKLKSLLNMEECNKWVGFFEDMCQRCEMEKLFKELLPMKSPLDRQAQNGKIEKLSRRMLVSLQYPYVCFASLHTGNSKHCVSQLRRPVNITGNQKEHVDDIPSEFQLQLHPGCHFDPALSLKRLVENSGTEGNGRDTPMLDIPEQGDSERGAPPAKKSRTRAAHRVPQTDHMKYPKNNDLNKDGSEPSGSGSSDQLLEMEYGQQDHFEDGDFNQVENGLMDSGEAQEVPATKGFTMKEIRKNLASDASDYYTVTASLPKLEAAVNQGDVPAELIEKFLEYANCEKERLSTSTVECKKDDRTESELAKYLNKMVTSIAVPMIKERVKASGKSKKDQNEPFGLPRSPYAISFTTRNFHDPLKHTGKELADAAREGALKGKNSAYETRRFMNLADFAGDYIEKYKKRVNKEEGRICKKNEWLDIPTPIIDARNHSDEKLREMASAHPMVCIRYLEEKRGIDLSKFLLENIDGKIKKLDMKVDLQLPQKLKVNKNLKNGKSTWKTDDYAHEESNLEEVQKHFENQRKVVDKFIQTLKKNGEMKKEDYEALKKKLTVNLMKFRVWFATNVPLPKVGDNETDDGNMYSSLWEQIEKMPEWMQPDSNTDLLRCTKLAIDGLNRPQLYFKEAGVRTLCHIENSGLFSLNWNAGPDISVWFCVPFEFGMKMEALVREKMKSRYMHPSIHHNDYWPLPDEVRAAEIPLQVFEQEAGDLVVISPGTFHWVQSIGNTSQPSWNLGLPTKEQIDMMAFLYDHQVINYSRPVVNMPKLIWNLVKDKHPFEKNAKTSILHLFTKCLECSQMELALLEVRGQSSTPMPAEGEYWSDHCWNNSCGSHLYNVVARRDEKSYCVHHAESGAKSAKSAEPVYYHQYTMSEAIQMFDGFKRDHFNL